MINEDLFPTLDECNELIDWLEENNDIDLNQVKFRIRELEDGSGTFMVSAIWLNRTRNRQPSASELLPPPNWVIDPSFWNGDLWMTCFWRNRK